MTIHPADYRFFVPGTPMPWKRAGRDKRSGRTFTPKEVKTRKADVVIIGGAAMRASGHKMAPKGIPVLLRVEACFNVPPSIPKWDRERRLALGYHTQVPDGDNIAKLIKDALNGVAWHDDCQVQIDGVSKMWVTSGSGVRVFIKSIYPRGE